MTFLKWQFLRSILLVLLCHLTRTVSQLASPVIVRETDTANLRWQIPARESFSVIIVLNPSAYNVLRADAANQTTFYGDYSTRVTYTGALSARTMAFGLRDVRRSDNGTYQCGRNLPSAIIDNCGQKLIVLGQPSEPVLSGPSVPVYGRQVTLTCTATSTTVPSDHGLTLTYTWQRDNADITVTSPGSSYTFTVNTRDTHSYRCRARESQDLESVWSDVYNMVPEYSPYEISLQPSSLSYTKTEGQESVPPITCSARCRPACSYRWFKRGIVFRIGGTLNLGQADRIQAGSYQCQATNIHGTTPSADVSVDITYRPEVSPDTPPGSSTCRPYRVYEGQQNVQLTCRVTAANPAVTSYIWTHNGSPVPSATSSVYTLSPVRRSSGGSYTCAGRNSVGTSDTSSVTVDVQYGPSVTVNPSTSTVLEGNTLTVTSSVDSNPSASVIWTRKDGGSFTPQNVSTLTITNIHRSQAGTYVCTANSILSSCSGAAPTSIPMSKEVTVDVQYSASIKNLTINSMSGSVTVNENDRVTLSCQVDSNPNSTIRLMNGSQELIRADNSLVVIHDWEADCRQRGDYSCTSNNNIGVDVNSVVKLAVKCSPRTEEALKHQFKYASTLGGNVTVSVPVLSYPAPTFTWSRTSSTFQNLTGSLIHVSDISVHITCDLIHLKQQDFGSYTLTVDNGVGLSALFTVNIVPQGPPTTPTNVTVTSDEPGVIVIYWKGEYNGGSSQTFTLEYSKDRNRWNIGGIYNESKEYGYHQATITSVNPSTVYYVRVTSGNIFGQSSYTEAVPVVTKSVKGEPPPPQSNTGIIVGVTLGILAIMAILVVGGILLMRKGFRCVVLTPGKEVVNRSTTHDDFNNTAYSATDPPSQSHYSELNRADADEQTYTELKTYVNIEHKHRPETTVCDKFQNIQTAPYENLNTDTHQKTPGQQSGE